MKNTIVNKKILSKCRACEHLCCNYITVKIKAPRTIRDFDGLVWQLSHQNIRAFRDYKGWHLIIYNKCSHLKSNGKCSIYDNRPITCREYSVEECEYNGSIADTSLQYFESYKSLNDYCIERFKSWKRRFL
jgi:Fe-S-cluster containining protein